MCSDLSADYVRTEWKTCRLRMKTLYWIEDNLIISQTGRELYMRNPMNFNKLPFFNPIFLISLLALALFFVILFYIVGPYLQ